MELLIQLTSSSIVCKADGSIFFMRDRFQEAVVVIITYSLHFQAFFLCHHPREQTLSIIVRRSHARLHVGTRATNHFSPLAAHRSRSNVPDGSSCRRRLSPRCDALCTWCPLTNYVLIFSGDSIDCLRWPVTDS